jgi:hypothetical protein
MTKQITREFEVWWEMGLEYTAPWFWMPVVLVALALTWGCVALAWKRAGGDAPASPAKAKGARRK